MFIICVKLRFTQIKKIEILTSCMFLIIVYVIKMPYGNTPPIYYPSYHINPSGYYGRERESIERSNRINASASVSNNNFVSPYDVTHNCGSTGRYMVHSYGDSDRIIRSPYY